jgi:carbonic anhydrase/acetyltransferase-like protein (isoleucine patch superfamily)
VIADEALIAFSSDIIGDVRFGKNCYIGWGAIIRDDRGTIIIGDEYAILVIFLLTFVAVFTHDIERREIML